MYEFLEFMWYKLRTENVWIEFLGSRLSGFHLQKREELSRTKVSESCVFRAAVQACFGGGLRVSGAHSPFHS